METCTDRGQSLVEATVLLLLLVLAVFIQMMHMSAVHERTIQQAASLGSCDDRKIFIFEKSTARLESPQAVAAVASFGFVELVGYFEKPAESSAESVDTLIPAGFLLIPIEVQNYESLDSLLGKYGVVDLFKGTGKTGRLVARNIRILRAPQNPSHFAVLTPESEAPNILAESGGFYVAVKPPHQGGTQIVNPEAFITPNSI